MALVKYKVLQSGVTDGVSDIPEKATPLGVWVGDDGKTVVAFMMKYADWAEEFPEDARKEEEKEKAEGQEEGGTNA